MDDAVDRDRPLNNLLQPRFLLIRGNFCIDPAVAFEDTEDNCFRSGASTSFTLNSPGHEVGFVDFDLSSEGPVEAAFIDQPSADSLIDRVDRADAEPTLIGILRGWEIKCKYALDLPECAFQKSSLVCSIPIHIISLTVN